MATSCWFCARDLKGARTVEHVVPQWLLDRQGIRKAPYEGRHLDDRGEVVTHRRHAVGDLKLGICGPCNNGWMADLEGEAQPVLDRLIRGYVPRSRHLTSAEQETVARWALKTVACFNRASNFHRIVPDEHFLHLQRGSAGLPSGVEVALLASPAEVPFDWIQSQEWSFYGRAGRTVEELSSEVVRSYKVAMRFGRFAFVVHYWPNEDFLRGLTWGFHQPLLPTTKPCVWQHPAAPADVPNEGWLQHAVESIALYMPANHPWDEHLRRNRVFMAPEERVVAQYPGWIDPRT